MHILCISFCTQFLYLSVLHFRGESILFTVYRCLKFKKKTDKNDYYFILSLHSFLPSELWSPASSSSCVPSSPVYQFLHLIYAPVVVGICTLQRFSFFFNYHIIMSFEKFFFLPPIELQLHLPADSVQIIVILF